MRIYTLPVIIILILGLIIDAYIYFQIKGNKNIITRILRNIHVATSIALGAFAIFLAIAPNHYGCTTCLRSPSASIVM